MGNKKRAKNIRLNGINPLAYLGVNPYTPPGFYLFQRDPTVNDIHNFIIGDLWLNTQTDPPTAPEIDNLWMLVSLTNNIATWVNFGGGDVEALEGDTGGPVSPDGAGIIHTIGDTVQQFVQVNGTPATNTLEWRIIQPNTDAGLLIGNTAANSPLVGDLVSPDGSVLINYASPNIQLRTLGDPTTQFANFGMTIAAGVITIHSADGSAFSATNRGILDFPSRVNPGRRVRIIITANVSMNFTDMNGNTLGTTAALAWGNTMPLYIYAVINDAENAATFAWARVPHNTTSGATLGSPASATANDEMSLFLFQSVTLAQYDLNPVISMGSATATKNAADSWTWDALIPGATGINCWNENAFFFTVPGQNGAPAGQILWSDPATTTTPIPDGQDALAYRIKKDGTYSFDYSGPAINIGVAGVGLVPATDTVYIMLPIGGARVSSTGIFTSGALDVAMTPPVLWWGVTSGLLPNGHYGVFLLNIPPVGLLAGQFTQVGEKWPVGAAITSANNNS